jgi:hypothetical protein
LVNIFFNLRQIKNFIYPDAPRRIMKGSSTSGKRVDDPYQFEIMLASHEQKTRISTLEKSRRRTNQNDQIGLPNIAEHIDVSFLTRRRCVSSRRKASDRNNQQREGNMNGNEKGTLERCLNTRKKTRVTKRKNQPLWRINL